jgi:hypothetical protein
MILLAVLVGFGEWEWKSKKVRVRLKRPSDLMFRQAQHEVLILGSL